MSRTADPTARIALIRAAEEVFAEKGLGAAKVEEITRRAGHSKGAFYLHFDSKEDAFKLVVESFLARCGAHFRPPSELALPDSPRALVAFWFEQDLEIFEFLWQNRGIVRIIQGCQHELSYLFDAFHEGVRQTSQEWLRFWKSRDLFRADVDEDLTSTLMSGAYNELAQRMLRESKRPPLEDWVATAQLTFARALGTPALLEVLGNSLVSQRIETKAGRRARAE